MKTYEEMARDVLKRRDEELLKIQNTQSFNTFDAPPEVAYPASPKKHGLLPKIAIPCAAAVLVGAVGVTVWRNAPNRGRYIQIGVATGDHTEIMPEDSYSVWVSDCHSGTPGSARETKINIVKLDDHPLGKNEGADQVHIEIGNDPNCKFELLTMEELNELYQIEFNRLSRLHTDWSEEHGDLQRIVREYPGVTTESYAASGSREIISTSNTLTYKTPSGAKIEITADRDFKTELSELGFSEEEFSVLGGYRAIVASASHDGEILYGAIIDMAGTNVQISAEGLSEDEFVKVLREYTECETSEDIIIIHDFIPEFFEEINPFNQYNDQYAPSELTFEPIDDINRFYGLEFDRLTKLRSDWQEQHIEFGIYSRYFEDEFSVGKEIVSTRNSIHYTLPNTAELYVTAMTGSLNLVTPGVPLTGERVYSRVNGCDAMIYRNGDMYNARIYPNGNATFGAVVEMGNAVLHFSAAGLTEEEFLGALRDFTAPNPEFDASQVVVDAVMPFPETADYGLTAFDAFDLSEMRSFTVTLGKHTIDLKPNYEYPYGVIMTEEGETASKYISEFFGTDIFPIDEQYKNSFRRLVNHGYFICDVAPKTTLVSPVEGRVIGVNKLETYSDLGFAVAVEFGEGNLFIATNLENVNVSVGETVTAGRILGTCGNTGETVGYRLGLYLLKIFGRDE